MNEAQQRELLANYVGGEAALAMFSSHVDHGGDKTCRQLAEDFNVAPGTVSRNIRRVADRMRRLKSMKY